MLNKQKPSSHPARLTSCHPSAPFIHPVALILVTSPQSLSPPLRDNGCFQRYPLSLLVCPSSKVPPRSSLISSITLSFVFSSSYPSFAGSSSKDDGWLPQGWTSSLLWGIFFSPMCASDMLETPNLPLQARPSFRFTELPAHQLLPLDALRISNLTLLKTPSLQIPPPSPPWPSPSQ